MRGIPEARVVRRAAFLGLLLVLAGLHLFAVFRDNIHGDEFALLQRAEAASRTGVLSGGGRPGLGTLILIPFAAACENAAQTIVRVRLFWLLFTFGGGVAFLILLRSILPPSRYRWAAMATGLALWTFAPDFLRYSIQVRTDQPAVFFALWGGVVLIASVRHSGMALLAGALFALGFLFSQKLVYVAALTCLIAAGKHWLEGDLRARREIARGLMALAGFALAVLVYAISVSAVSTTPTLVPVRGALDTFAYYRDVYGWTLYKGMLTSLMPQLATLVALVGLTVWAVGSVGRNHRRPVALAWMVALVGGGVAAFHAARFPYFYMVLGLFPATVGALLFEPFTAAVRRSWLRSLILVPLAGLLFLLAAAQSLLMSNDTLGHQVANIDFVNRNFAPEAHGFDSFGVFACRHDPDPFQVRFRQHLYAARSLDGGVELGRELIEAFETRPVSFMIPPANVYPPGFQSYWQARYVPYWESIWVPGMPIRGAAGSAWSLHVPVSGTYRWDSADPAAPSVYVSGRVLTPSDTVFLEAGPVALTLPEGGEGRLVWDIDEPPRKSSRLFFIPG